MASAGHVPTSDSKPRAASESRAVEESRSSADSGSVELERLESAVRRLVADREKLRDENDAMRLELETMSGLQESLRVEAQRRQDALKRIDDLVGMIEQLEPSLRAGAKAARK